jgi:glucose-6-phosphate dehydrogenase assembly protein OpcA
LEAIVTDDSRLDRFERGRAIEVAVDRIDAELQKLWQHAAERRGGQPQAITRACLWNLVVFGEVPTRTKMLIDEVASNIPARVILFRTEPGGNPILRAFVEANWRRAPDGQLLSGSDEVTLWATGAASEWLPALIRSLLVVDAPAALLCMDALPDPDSPGYRLLREADRFIIDSRSLSDEQRFSEVQALARSYPRLELADLAWLGLSSTLGLAASLFDPPRDPSLLHQLERVRVTSGVRGARARALLTLGWLAARLGWTEFRTVEDASRCRWQARRRTGELVLELVNRPDANHGVIAIEFQIASQRFAIERDDRCIRTTDPMGRVRAQPVRTHSDAELVVAALGARGRDPVYRDALAKAAELVL